MWCKNIFILELDKSFENSRHEAPIRSLNSRAFEFAAESFSYLSRVAFFYVTSWRFSIKKKVLRFSLPQVKKIHFSWRIISLEKQAQLPESQLKILNWKLQILIRFFLNLHLGTGRFFHQSRSELKIKSASQLLKYLPNAPSYFFRIMAPVEWFSTQRSTITSANGWKTTWQFLKTSLLLNAEIWPCLALVSLMLSVLMAMVSLS